jgi:Zn-finger in ubiquitin-hydrolases and other protein
MSSNADAEGVSSALATESAGGGDGGDGGDGGGHGNGDDEEEEPPAKRLRSDPPVAGAPDFAPDVKREPFLASGGTGSAAVVSSEHAAGHMGHIGHAGHAEHTEYPTGTAFASGGSEVTGTTAAAEDEIPSIEEDVTPQAAVAVILGGLIEPLSRCVGCFPSPPAFTGVPVDGNLEGVPAMGPARLAVCLHCVFVGCWGELDDVFGGTGSAGYGHMREHLVSMQHTFALQLGSSRVYCAECCCEILNADSIHHMLSQVCPFCCCCCVLKILPAFSKTPFRKLVFPPFFFRGSRFFFPFPPPLFPFLASGK